MQVTSFHYVQSTHQTGSSSDGFKVSLVAVIMLSDVANTITWHS